MHRLEQYKGFFVGFPHPAHSRTGRGGYDFASIPVRHFRLQCFRAFHFANDSRLPEGRTRRNMGDPHFAHGFDSRPQMGDPPGF